MTCPSDEVCFHSLVSEVNILLHFSQYYFLMKDFSINHVIVYWIVVEFYFPFFLNHILNISDEREFTRDFGLFSHIHCQGTLGILRSIGNQVDVVRLNEVHCLNYLNRNIVEK